MKRFQYIVPAVLLGFSMVACDDDDTYEVLDGLDMIVRTQTISEGESVRAAFTPTMTIAYNNLVGIAEGVPVTLNGQLVSLKVNPENGMELILTLPEMTDFTEYTLEIPEGAVFIKDRPETKAAAKTVKFNTNAGINAEWLDKNLTNANATPEAKKVFQYLLDNYGKTQLSGCMSDEAWGTRYVDFITTEAGHTPAVLGFDYGHLASSPANWIDYGDITPVKTAWDNGSIPSISWHWNVPGSEQHILSTVWEGNMVIDSWEALQLTPDMKKTVTDDEGNTSEIGVFDDLQSGQCILVKVKDIDMTRAQGSLKSLSDGWPELGPDGTSGYENGTEYFDIRDNYSLITNRAIVDDIKTNGFVVSGQGYTVTGVYITDGDPLLAYNADRSFNPKNAVTAGTWENEVINKDIAKLAGYLKLLQNAGIPVLWRPLHEAAGDYSNGPWFWWGTGAVTDEDGKVVTSGEAVTIELWKYLRNKLQNEYGLNNLIWVWTVQTTDGGNLASVDQCRAAYPGDDMVDIVGADLYIEGDNLYGLDPDKEFNPEATDQTRKFDLVNNTVKFKKMVVLSECGNLLLPATAEKYNALWGYFMQWYDMKDGEMGFHTYNGASVWNDVMTSPLVRNRGDFNVK